MAPKNAKGGKEDAKAGGRQVAGAADGAAAGAAAVGADVGSGGAQGAAAVKAPDAGAEFRNEMFDPKRQWEIIDLPEALQQFVWYTEDRNEPHFHPELHGDKGCCGLPQSPEDSDFLSLCDEDASELCDPMRVDLRERNPLRFCAYCCRLYSRATGTACSVHAATAAEKRKRAAEKKAAAASAMPAAGSAGVAAAGGQSPAISQSLIGNGVVVAPAVVNGAAGGAAGGADMATMMAVLQATLSRLEMRFEAVDRRVEQAERAAAEARNAARAAGAAAAAGAGTGRAYIAAALQDAKENAGKVFTKQAVKQVDELGLDAPEKVTPSAALPARETADGTDDWVAGGTERPLNINPIKIFRKTLVPMAERARTDAANTDPRAAKAKTCVELWGSADKLWRLLIGELSVAAQRIVEARGDAKKSAVATSWHEWLEEYVERYRVVEKAHGAKAMEWHSQAMQHAHLYANGDKAVVAANEWLSSGVQKHGAVADTTAKGRGGRSGRGRGGGRAWAGASAGGEDRYPKDKKGNAKCRFTAQNKACPKGLACRYSHEE